MPLEEAELTGSQDSGIIRCKQQNLESDEIQTLLNAGKFITKLSLAWKNVCLLFSMKIAR